MENCWKAHQFTRGAQLGLVFEYKAQAAIRYLQNVHFQIKQTRDFAPSLADYMFQKTRQNFVRDFCFLMVDWYDGGKPNC